MYKMMDRFHAECTDHVCFFFFISYSNMQICLLSKGEKKAAPAICINVPYVLYFGMSPSESKQHTRAKLHLYANTP